MRRLWKMNSGKHGLLTDRFHKYMKKAAIAIGMVLFLFGCKPSSKYPFLSTGKFLHQNVYGGFVEINTKNNKKFNGELISVQAEMIVVLNWKTSEVESISLKDVGSIYLRIANGLNYHSASILLNLTTLSHGFFFIYTFPINMLTTRIIASSRHAGYTKKIKKEPGKNDLEILKKYSRFPQGIPPEVALSDIKGITVLNRK